MSHLRQVRNYKRLVAPITYMLSSEDDVIDVDTTNGLATIYIPNIQANATIDRKFYINDATNNAQANPITLVCIDGNTINNSPTLGLNVNGISAQVIIVDQNKYLANLNTDNTGGGGGIAFTSVTYAALQTLIGTSALVQGNYYLINDYQTIYDQPDYNAIGSPKPVVTTNTGTVEPLIVQASSVNKINERAISTLYPLDVIQYDVTFTQTEVMLQPAKGRIILRTDNNNNTTNYDHRQVVFKRYESFPSSGVYTEVYDNGNASLNTIPTFGADCYSNNIGNFYTALNPLNTGFILSNNVFEGNARNNKTGSDFYNNTFANNVYSNIFGNSCHYNVFEGSVLENIISNNFSLNKIGSRFWNNTVGDNFNNNITSTLFTDNQIENNFQYNILGNNFRSNKIGNNFQYNNISTYFGFDTGNNYYSGNTIGDNCHFNFIGNNFYSNFIKNSCTGNTFGATVTFNYTITSGTGYSAGTQISDLSSPSTTARIVSDIGTSMVVRAFTDTWYIGVIISDGVTEATLDSISVSYDATGLFTSNDIGNNFSSNQIANYFGYDADDNTRVGNRIADNFKDNIIAERFNSNVIGNSFSLNTIGLRFFSNKIGEYSNNNSVGDNVQYNIIGSQFSANIIGNIFEYNNIDNVFSSNAIGDDFKNNQIGNFFQENTITDLFKNNNICNGFASNTIGDSFQQNIFQSPTSLNYLAATFVYGGYNCIIFTNSNGTETLSYYDITNTLTIPPTPNS
jgi:hypothetical protein